MARIYAPLLATSRRPGRDVLPQRRVTIPLHEVRRLNSTVKVIAERVCRNEAQNDPEQANPDLVRAWKATELISYQLDAMDIYANPEIVRAIPNTECSFYKLVDKVVRIYRPIATSKSKTLRLTGDSSAISWVNNHTIHVIPSVYIDNAVKYSPANGTIKVDVAEVTHDDKEHVQITVCSIGPYATPEEERLLFRRRVRAVRATNTADGTGLGLLLAQRVADQHHAFLWHRQQRVDVGLSEWEFGFRMLAKRNSSTRTRVRKRS